MKKILLLLALVVGFGSQTMAQRACSTMENLDRLVQQDPRLVQKMDNLEKHIQRTIRDRKGLTQKTTITIPVVFHVIYNGSTENISEAQVMSQLQVLQEDFTLQNSDASNTPSEFASLVANVGINFVIADTDPNGNAHSGITRTSTSKSSFSTNDDMKYTSRGGHDAWPADQYLNFWICDLGSSLLGYAQFPGGSAATDGVVCHYKYTGTTGAATTPFHLGRTATHEVGHWLNLRHIWGDATCGNDQVDDTPTQLTSNTGCPSHPNNSCTSNDMFMNYMDYVNDACMYMFSEGQKERMLALFAEGGFRASFAGGGTPPPPASNYCASKGNSVNDEWIGNVTLNSFSNTTGANGGYADFSATEINLAPSEAVDLSLNPAFSGSTYAEYWKIWIDYNNDYDFDDAGELVFDAGGTSSSTVTGSFTVAANATGSTRMRVSMKYNGAQTSCEAFSYGEVEDYTVVFGEPEPEVCDAPTSVSASNVTDSGFDFSWAAMANAASYDVAYKLSSASTWTNTTASGTSKSISGLNASTNYNFRVRTVCSKGSSAYSNTGSVTTAAQVCEAASSVTVSNVGQTSFDLSWSSMTNAQSYNVDYRAEGGSWISSSQTGTSKNISGLTASTTYEFRVQTVCSQGTSAYSTTGSATTSNEPTPEYCATQGNSVSDEWIANITVGSFSNSTGANGGYADFSATEVSLVAGENYSLSLSPGFSGSSYAEYWKIWIDYNNDYDFDDAGELAFDAGGTSSSTVTGSFTVAANATGSTRMRVSMKYNGAQTSCEAFTYGEVEDYTVVFGEPIPEVCDAPTSTEVSNIGESTATFTWDAMPNTASYTAEIRAVGGSWSSYATSAAGVSYSGLAAETSYEVRVTTVCSEGSSAASAIVAFTTLEASPEPVTYCTSSGSNSSDEWIASVSIGSVTNNSGNNGGYGDFTGTVISASVGGSVSFTLKPGFTSGFFGLSTYPEYWRIFADLNKDGDFTDAGEMVYDAGLNSTTDVSGSFTIPTGSATGDTRLRVSMKYNGASTSCETFGYGEVEDYTLSISNSAKTTSTPSLTARLYPNPVNDKMNIVGLNNATVRIMDLSGRVVFFENVSGPSLHLFTEVWESGLYIAQIIEGDNSTQIKFVVN